MAVTYFGTCNSSGVTNFSTADDSGGWTWTCHTGSSFACPGSGNQTVKELSTIVSINSGTPHVRLVLYDSLGNMVCQGSAEVVVTAGYSWQGHMTASALTPAGGSAGDPVTITGGSQYRIGVSRDASGVLATYKSGTVTNGDIDYGATDYTGGWPATIPTGTDYTVLLTSIRCGVEPAAGGGVVTGTATASITEADVVTGGKEIIITLTGDTFIA